MMRFELWGFDRQRTPVDMRDVGSGGIERYRIGNDYMPHTPDFQLVDLRLVVLVNLDARTFVGYKGCI